MTIDAPPQIFLDALVAALERAGRHNPDDQVAPVAILWPDKAREWEPLIPLVADRLPIITLGDFDPANRKGPSYWIRCVVARQLEEPHVPAGQIPIVYLPGLSKQDIRAVEDCPKELQPIAFLQYDGALFVHDNGRDWTVRGFLETSSGGGLGLQLGADNATRDATKRALRKLADVPVARLRAEAPLKAAFFDALLSPDEAGNLLAWINDPDGFQKRCEAEEWAAFRSVSSTKYGIDPEKDGPITAARRLGERADAAWQLAWSRFAEAPSLYPGIPERLRAARPMVKDMFSSSDAWPQDNESAEDALRGRLKAAAECLPEQASNMVLGAETEHAPRRDWVWCRLGQAPLAIAVGHLSLLAASSGQTLTGATTAEIASRYVESGWQTDGAVMAALAAVERPDDVTAVKAVIRAIYEPWLEKGVREFQRCVGDGGPDEYRVEPLADQPEGTCLVFVDGLRLDVAHQLMDSLAGRGYACDLQWRLTALPPITSTAKPAVSPVATQLRGGPELSPTTVAGGTVDVNALRKLLKDSGYQVLTGVDLLGDPNGRAWTECGDIDNAGHTRGIALAGQLGTLVQEINHRIAELIDQGWERVVLVTDHGWLLMPGGLPKAELPEHLTEKRKGRCARMKPLSNTAHQQVPWYWDRTVSFAISPGIACFEAGKEYEHGGLSPQECVTPMLTVTRGAQEKAVSIVSVDWRGLRCVVEVAGAPEGSSVDLRDEPSNVGTSLAGGGRQLDEAGKASLLVPDESRESTPTRLVVLAPDGQLLAQTDTLVGGDADGT